MPKTREEYIEMYLNQIKEAQEKIDKINDQKIKEKEEGKIPDHKLDSEISKQDKILKMNTQLLNAMGIDSVESNL